MTRQRFFGLRQELVRRICKQYDPNQKPNYRELRDLKPDFTKVHSYKEAWETLKPARDLVGM